MLRNKRILLILIFTIALFLIPSICNASEIQATQTTQTSTGKTVKWSYELDGESIINLKCTNKSEITGEVNIPSTIDGYKVVALGAKSWLSGEGVFKECKGLTGVTIPDTVVTIGEEAFYNCTGLQKVTIPNSVITIKSLAFTRTMISSLNIPNSVVTIESYAFDGCSGIKELKIPESVVTIGDAAFENCSGMKSLTIQSNVLTSIGASAFKNCVAIQNVTIPNSVTTLGVSAFEDCTGLRNITLSNNLTKLQRDVFSGCSSLTSVIIPESVTTIDGYNGSIYGAFQDCTRLEKVRIPDTVAFIEKSAFHNCPKLTIYGNDNQASKTYAQENNINFDYIANWDKANSGSDIAAPTVTKMYIDYSSILNYWDSTTNSHRVPTGGKIRIVVNFSEEITGKTAPTLAIKCGVGSNINITGGAIAGKTVTYEYTIKSTDLGQISSVSLTGGDIVDLSGNKAELSCTSNLYIEHYGGYAYANGSGATVEDDKDGKEESTTATLSAITITKAPTKVNYSKGEKFDKTGMVVTAKYSDDTSKTITNYTVSPTVELKTTDKEIVVTYTENGVTKTAKQAITVLEKANTTTITLTSIKITKAPTKIKYTEGEKFSTAGMIVTATYSDGSTKQLTNYTFSPSGALKTTNKKITVAYTENGVTKTAEQSISVVKDSTIKNDTKLPQTGMAVISLAVVALIAVAVVSKIKYGSYKDI